MAPMKERAHNIEKSIEKREEGMTAKAVYAVRSLLVALGIVQSGAKSVYNRPKSTNVSPGERVKTFTVVALSIVSLFIVMGLLITLIRLLLGGVIG